VAFDHGQVYLSYPDPTNVGDLVVQQLDNGNDPSRSLKTTTILRLGDTGAYIATGEVNRLLPVAQIGRRWRSRDQLGQQVADAGVDLITFRRRYAEHREMRP
jgi:hypothetical protein